MEGWADTEPVEPAARRLGRTSYGREFHLCGSSSVLRGLPAHTGASGYIQDTLVCCEVSGKRDDRPTNEGIRCAGHCDRAASRRLADHLRRRCGLFQPTDAVEPSVAWIVRR